MSDSTPPIDLNHSRQGGYNLNDLLDLLYIPPPNPDIITREDVLVRYRLTGFAAPAITALQQAQRIVRTGKDYCQIGLCEFHIGLIYLHWGHCLAAAQQFSEARRQWLFADEIASVCLTYFAEGQAQHLALHYESAMSCYHKTEKWLPRLRLVPPSAKLDEFVQKITELLQEAQEALRTKMWPPDEPEKKSESASHSEARPDTAAHDTESEAEATEELASEPEAAVEPTPTTVTDSHVPLPRVNVVHESVTPQVSPAAFSTLHDIPVPFFTQDAAEPASVVLPLKEHYKWFRVVERQGDIMPFIRTGTSLLVDTQVRERYKKDEFILIGSDQNEVQGNIQVEPYLRPPIYKRIVLRRVPPDGLAFTRDASGRVKFELPSMTFVVGVVLGFWLNPLQAGLEARWSNEV